MQSEQIQKWIQYNIQMGIKIITQPVDVTARLGEYVSLSAVVKTCQPNYQWFQGRDAMPHMNKSYLEIGPVNESDYGLYRLSILDEVTNQNIFTRWVRIKPELRPLCMHTPRYRYV